MYVVELAKKVENAITLHLIAARLANPEDYTISRLYVYDFVVKEYSKYGIITAGFFSRIVGDMKKTGIIGTAKGGDVLFVSDAYWELSGSKGLFEKRFAEREKMAAEVIKHLSPNDEMAEWGIVSKSFDELLAVAPSSHVLAEAIRALVNAGVIERNGDPDSYRLTLDTVCTNMEVGGAR
jgi:hypothetical protein